MQISLFVLNVSITAFFFSQGSNQDSGIAFGCYTFFVSLMYAKTLTLPYLLFVFHEVDFFFFKSRKLS